MSRKHIVVMGGGFSGSLAAIVAAKYAQQVTVVERFADAEASKWAGTPQSNHGHSMSKKGQSILEKLVPGILEELAAQGATDLDWAQDTAWHGPFGPCPHYVSGIRSLSFSRKLIGKLLDARAKALPNVRFVVGSVLSLDIQNRRVEAIHLKGGEVLKDFDLCLDARGRTAQIKEGLEAHVGRIPENRIENTVRYITSVVNHKFSPPERAMQYYRQPNASNSPLGIYASPIENDRVIFTIVDYHGNVDKPFEQLQSHPLLKGKVVRNISVFSKLHNHHTQFGKARTWISNLVVIGDAICRLNPVYGLGMTVSIEHVERLDRALRRHSVLKTHRLQKALDRTIREPWFLIKIEEMRAPKASPNIIYRLTHAYLDGLARATTHDIKLHRTSLEVIQRLKSPLTIFLPPSMVRVLRSSFAHAFSSLLKRPRQDILKAPAPTLPIFSDLLKDAR